ncbi:MAG: regulatory protein RecX [Actinomycetota bacterium]
MSAEEVAADRDVEAAVAFLLRSTRARPQTEAEVRAKLLERGWDDEAASAALGRGRELGALDDAAFARAWVEDRGLGRGYGASRLRRELTRRQVPDDLIDTAMHAVEQRDEEAVALELATERAARLPSDLDPERLAGRLVGFLARRGYPEGLARRVALRASGLDRRWD